MKAEQIIKQKPSRMIDLISTVQNKGTQLSALLTSMYGGGAENFEAIGAERRDALIWLAYDVCEELNVAAGQLTAAKT